MKNVFLTKGPDCLDPLAPSSTLLSPYTKNKFSPDEAQLIMHTINHGVIMDGCLILPPTLHKV